MNKYIVKNCPSCRYTPKRYIEGIDYICWNAQNFSKSAKGICQDCTDCLIKQVIEKCKDAQDKEYRKGSWKFRSPSKAKFGREILQLFEIEEDDYKKKKYNTGKIKRTECPYNGIDCAWCGEECE